ncbi:MAG: leucine-rich repeat domain-containing protein [Algicola sp.]|nr:leucine-rich repeat domain-containing protein [Algicola sp.]
MSVNVNKVNEFPVVEAGDDQNRFENVVITLTGGASDTDGNIVSAQWQQTAGTAVTLADNNSLVTTFTAPNVDSSEVLTFELTVTDSDGAVVVDMTHITTNPDLLISEVVVASDRLKECIIDSAAAEGHTNISQVSQLTCAKNVFYLSGIEQFISLTELVIRTLNKPDLTPLGALISLKTLTINGGEITDISVLANLHQLVRLEFGVAHLPISYVQFNDISDLTPLIGLTSLQELIIPNNKVSDISPLFNISSLRILDLSGNPLTSGIDIGQLTQLTSLTARHAGVRGWVGIGALDISLIGNLTSLKTLDLSRNIIGDTTPLGGLTSLSTLKLNENEITDTSFLTHLTALETLELNDNLITDITPLAGLTLLSSVWMNTNNISDITPLSGLTLLTSIDLQSNEVSDITALAGLTLLTRLWANYNNVTDISALSELTSLSELELRDSTIVDISPLERLTALTRLNLKSNAIVDVSALSQLTSLTFLGLAVNQIEDVTPLITLININYLDLVVNNITCISLDLLVNTLTNSDIRVSSDCVATPDMPIELINFFDENLKKCMLDTATQNGWTTVGEITSLDCQSQDILYISPLQNLMNLSSLNLANNAITRVDKLFDLAKLTSVNLVGNNSILCDDLTQLDSLFGAQAIARPESCQP